MGSANTEPLRQRQIAEEPEGQAIDQDRGPGHGQQPKQQPEQAKGDQAYDENAGPHHIGSPGDSGFQQVDGQEGDKRPGGKKKQRQVILPIPHDETT